MKVREPVARPLDVVGLELLLTASQAFLVGVLVYLAIGVWDDRGVGFGPVASMLALLGTAVGGAWLFWLLGGVGWPLAAADVPVAIFLGAALVLGWTGEAVFSVPGVPLMLSVAAAVYGIVGGVFIDSPRRWRWDQRQRPRSGTQVPRVSPTTRSLVARMPRSVPRRPVRTTTSELVARIGRSRTQAPREVELIAPVAATSKDVPIDAAAAGVPARGSASGMPPAGSAAAVSVPGEPSHVRESDGAGQALSDRPTPAAGGGPSPASGPAGLVPGGGAAQAGAERAAIELPTSVEPRAQRSPWAWAAPPAWSREEEDEAASERSSTRT